MKSSRLQKEIKKGMAQNLEQIIACGGKITLKEKNWLEEYRGTTIQADILTDKEDEERIKEQ